MNGAAKTNPPAPAARPPRRRPWVVALVAVLAVAVLLLAAVGAGLAWVWNDAGAQQRLLAQVPGLQIEGSRGSLTGGAWSAQRVLWEGGGLRVEVESPGWDGAHWRWRPHARAWAGVELQSPRASRVLVRRTAPPRPEPPAQAPPQSLRLPVEFVARGLRIGSVEVFDQAPLTDLSADLHAGAADGTHRVERLALQREGLALGGAAVLGGGEGLPLQARVTAATLPGAAQSWQAQAQAEGPLERLALQVRLELAGGAAATAQATVAPFAPWPLLALSADATDLDLAAIAPGLPQTRLSGHAQLAEPGRGADDPLALDVQLDNALPGTVDAGRVPVQRVQLRLRARPADAGVYDFERLQVDLGALRAVPPVRAPRGRANAPAAAASAPAPVVDPAGSIGGSGRWQGRQLALTLELQGLRTERLDARAPPLTVNGPVTIALDGMAAPGSPAAAPPPIGTEPAPVPLGGRVEVDLQAATSRRGVPPLALQAQATFAQPGDGTLSAALTQARLAPRGAPGAVTATVAADRDAAGAWRLQSRGAIQRFDPAPWWPAAAPPRGAAQQLDGRWQADLALPPGDAPLLDRVLGKAGFTLDPSRWAGVAWQGRAELDADARALQLAADLRAGANRAQASARLPRPPAAAVPARPASGVAAPAAPAARRPAAAPALQARVDVDAPDLAAFAPLQRLLPASAAAWWPRSGTVTAQAGVDGRWPALRSAGELNVQRWRSDAATVGRARARWDLASPAAGADAPLALQLEAAALALGPRRLDSATASLEGSLRRHTLEIRATSPLRPPAWAEVAAAAPTPGGSEFLVRGSGAWSPAGAGGAAGTWRGTLAELRAAPRAGGAAWLSASQLQAQATLDAEGGLQQAALAPGRVDAFGGAVVWQQAQYQAPAAPGALPRLALQARLEPLRVAPFLVRLQPQFGWRGDLAVAGTVDVRSGDRFDADIVVERTGGDLSLTVEGATRALELNNLRFGIAAHGGQWDFTQAIVGRSIGIVGGLQSIRTSPAAWWPGPTAPLSGGVSLQVPELAVWAPWLPPGWRLGGQLRVAASFGGSFAEPAYRGEATGEDLAVRNLFEGINLRRGQLAVALDGRQATIQRFEFSDGAENSPGLLRVTGGASFGAAPRAQLRVVAERLRALDRFDRRITVSGAAELDAQAARLVARGAFKVDEGLIDATQADAPANDADVVVVNRPPLRSAGPAGAAPAARPPSALVPAVAASAPAGAASAQPAPAPGAFANADVDLAIDLGDNLRLRGRGIDTHLRGKLRVTTPGGQLAVNGTVDVQGGTYTAYGQNLRIERGLLHFSGNVSTPQLDILALRADIDQRVGVVVTGNVANPRVRLYSEPDLGELDTLTWLLLGRAPEGLGRDDAALLQRAALALLAGERGGGGFVQRLGLDELSLRRGSGSGSDGNLDATVVSLGKQLSKRLYVGYEQALNAAGGTLQLIYRIANRLTLRAQTGVENAVDVIWTWRWN